MIEHVFASLGDSGRWTACMRNCVIVTKLKAGLQGYHHATRVMTQLLDRHCLGLALLHIVLSIVWVRYCCLDFRSRAQNQCLSSRPFRCLPMSASASQAMDGNRPAVTTIKTRPKRRAYAERRCCTTVVGFPHTRSTEPRLALPSFFPRGLLYAH